jgi:hypothetical protein
MYVQIIHTSYMILHRFEHPIHLSYDGKITFFDTICIE